MNELIQNVGLNSKVGQNSNILNTDTDFMAIYIRINTHFGT